MSPHVQINIYTQIGFVRNGWEREKLCYSEIVYWGISVSIGINKFISAVYDDLTTCSNDLMAITMVVMETTRTNWYITRFFVVGNEREVEKLC